MIEENIREFWQTHPCGAGLVGDLSDRTRAEYLDFFERYDTFRYRKEPHIIRNLERIDWKGKRVLEVGMGQGADGEQIVNRGGRYSGVDLTEESVERVRMRFDLKGIAYDRIERSSVLDLPFGDSEFDIVFSHGVLHHVPEIRQAQSEIARVLKASGRLIIMLYAKRSLNYLFAISVLRRVGLAALYVTGIRPGGIYTQHIDNAKKTGLARYLKMANFINVSTDGPENPYSKVYDRREIERDLPDFELVRMHQEFMHAPPLPVSRLPFSSLLGWHLWAELRPIK